MYPERTLARMPTIALVPDLTGKSEYITPPQSPTSLPIHDEFKNPERNGSEDSAKIDEEFESSMNAINALSQISSNGSPPSSKTSPRDDTPDLPPRSPGRAIPSPYVEDGKPEVPPRPIGREIPLVAKEEKEAPPLPVRPTLTHPTRQAPKPMPDLPTRPAPTPLKERIILPPPTIPEETIEQIGDPPVKYSRQPEKLMAYLIPLPKPNLRKRLDREDDLPQRYLLYTPPRPHCLKPAEGVKEGKRHRGRRKLQEQVEKAKKYDGKTFSWRGLHSKTTRGVIWAVNRIRATDLVFLGRIKNKEVDEIVLVFPDVPHTIPQVREEFIAQITRTKNRAAKESAISTFLLPVTLVIDTFAAVFWPFGGLFEIDAVWCYAATNGWHTSRRITKRLGTRESRLKEYGGKERDLFLRFHQDADIEVLRRYVAEACHKRNPDMFDSVGVPPTESDVAKAIGWKPVLRGKTGGVRVEGEGEGEGSIWAADEEWQRVMFADDLKAVAERGARSWDNWGKKFEKKPDKALKR